MIRRSLEKQLKQYLDQFPAVALLGPRQVGKTTLAKSLSPDKPALYLDLENPVDLAKLDDAREYLSGHQEKLIIIDEVQRAPALFQVLRGLIDERIQAGEPNAQFLLLGSASMDLLRQSSESLAGRIAYLELGGLSIDEVGNKNRQKLWVRGGFPLSFLSADDTQSTIWREQFIRTYLERDIPQLGPRVPAETLRRFWTMLAHSQGSLLNAAKLAKALSVDGKTVARYLDLMVDLLLVRRLEPFHANTGKRLVKSPKIYVRDSGLVHALLRLSDHEAVLGHPVAGMSWEGFVIETLVMAMHNRGESNFYRTSAGAEIDLLLTLPNGKQWAIEVKRGQSVKIAKGFYHALDDVQPDKAFAVYSGDERYSKRDGVEVIGLGELTGLIRASLN